VDSDEITTKIEIRSPKSDDNIVHINFQSRQPQRATQATAATNNSSVVASSVSIDSNSFFSKLKQLDLRAPWVIRLVAVLTVLILSMLVL
jgi:hypothetical protein